MKLYAMFLMDLRPDDPGVEDMTAHLKEHTVISLNIRKLLATVGRENVPPEMMNAHRESSKKLGQLLGKCFSENADIKLEDCKWDTNDVLTKEEEASILAPEG